jgi:hypothetical protein
LCNAGAPPVSSGTVTGQTKAPAATAGQPRPAGARGLLEKSGITNTSAAPDVDTDALILALTTNDEKLGSIELGISQTTVVPGVAETVTTKTKLPGGINLTTTQRPRVEGKAHLIIGPGILRYDELDDQGDPKSVLSQESGKWTEFRLPQKRKIIRRLDQMGGNSPIDPRDFLAVDIRQPLVVSLRERRALESGFVLADGKRIYRRVLDIGGQKYEVHFDPRRGMLPVHVTLYHPAGPVLETLDVTYQHVDARGAWLLDTGLRKCFKVAQTDREESATAAAPKNAVPVRNPSILITTKCRIVKLLDDDSAHALLTPDLAGPFRVADMTVATPQRESRVDSVGRAGSWWPLLILNALIAAGIGFWLFFKGKWNLGRWGGRS